MINNCTTFGSQRANIEKISWWVTFELCKIDIGWCILPKVHTHTPFLGLGIVNNYSVIYTLTFLWVSKAFTCILKFYFLLITKWNHEILALHIKKSIYINAILKVDFFWQIVSCIFSHICPLEKARNKKWYLNFIRSFKMEMLIWIMPHDNNFTVC